jgi:hypothetical protein
MLGISRRDAYRQYLAYHEGQGGYKHRTYEKKPWLIKVSAPGGQSRQALPDPTGTMRRELNSGWSLWPF